MFLVRGAEGIQRALIPGEFRSRRTVEAVVGVPTATDVAAAETPTAEPRTQREALLARYQDPNTSPQPSEVCFAHEIMTTPVFSIHASTGIGEVITIFTEKRFRHIPVVSSTGLLIGLISDRDVLRYQATASGIGAGKTAQKVDTIMAREVLSASPSARIREVAQVMLDERVGSMPIIDSTESLVGIITRSDILRAVVRHGPVRLWA
jgi:acetoin utilization protein AcuB